MIQNTEITKGFIADEVYKVETIGNSRRLFDTEGRDVGTLGIGSWNRKEAYDRGQAMQAFMNSNGKKSYRKVDMSVYDALVAPVAPKIGRAHV